MKLIKRSRLLTLLTSLALLVCLSGGIMVADHASAQSPSSGKNKGSDDVQSKAHSVTNTETIKVIVQLRAPMSGSLNSLLNSNGVHIRKTFQNLGAHLVEMPASIFDAVAGFD
jgi:hypothetical protein